MNEAIDLTRALTGIIWLAVALYLSGSIFRALHGRTNHLDRSWVLCWVFAIHQLGFTIRWFQDWTYSAKPGTDALTLLGLNVLSSMIGLLVIWRRWTYGERSW